MARNFGYYSPTVPAGTTWEEELTVVDPDGVPVNLTGYVGRMHLRTTLAAASPSLELTSANGRLTIPDPVNGVLRITVAEADMSALLQAGARRATFLYDLELRNENVSPHYVIPIIQGRVTVTGRVTR